MVEKSIIVASNYWHQPGVKVTIRHDETAPHGSIHVEMSLDDFVKALSKEMTHPLKVWTRTAMEAAIQQAAKDAMEKVKLTTAVVM